LEVVKSVKVYTPRRVRERNRWLRSDGKPNFRNRVHERIHELDPLLREDVTPVNDSTPILRVCELMNSLSFRMIPVLNTSWEVLGVVSGMDVIDYLGGGSKHEIVLKKGIHLLYDALKLPASNIMTPNPVTADISAKFTKVLELMINYGVGALPILSKGVYRGIISELEIMKYLAGKPVGVKVKDVMTDDVITIDINSTLEDLMKLMVRAGIRRVPVTKYGSLAGITTWRSIVGLIGTHKIFELLNSKTVDELRALPLRQVLSKDIVRARPEDDIGDAAEAMVREGKGYALVIEDNVLRGIVTARDIIYGILVG